ncbi:lytic transglycosylase domain-containing protein [Thermosulfidibacter takaii]|uniref:lytic transglycosylase domain-containing protein n=1 Tax=Thermosulfidibacter takaii TaxID=412593 RepID=UPI00083811D5|nr:lytic transglycosylase domain-containing protein [Thermosulfidibacter takaii]
MLFLFWIFLSSGVRANEDITVDISVPEVRHFIQYYLGEDRPWVERAFERFCYYRSLVLKILSKYNIPEEIAVLPVLESGYSGFARSCSGAKGYWQFMRVTARRYGLGLSRWVDERGDIEKSTEAAAKYISYLYSLFKDWYFVLAAYNAGEGYVLKVIESTGIKDYWVLCRLGLLNKQVREFVPRFLALLWIYQNRETLGLEADHCSGLERVMLPSGVDLASLGTWMGLDVNLLKEFNAFLRKGKTPPWGAWVYVPKGYASKARLAVKWMMAAKHARELGIKRLKGFWIGYVVKPGDTLWSLSRSFGVDASVIKLVNRLKCSGLRAGSVILIPTKRLVASIVEVSPHTGKLVYRVKKGDTVWNIARIFGVKRSDILVSGNVLKPGQKVVIKLGGFDERG